MRRAIERSPWARCAAAGLTMTMAACGDTPGDGAIASEPLHTNTAPSPAAPLAPTAAELLGVTPVTPVVAAVPQPPRLPYALLGKWTAAGRTAVYLKRGDHSVVINAPGPLDEQYAVQSLDERRMVLKYLPLGTLQTIDLDAVPARSTSTARTAPVAPAAPAGDDQQSDN